MKLTLSNKLVWAPCLIKYLMIRELESDSADHINAVQPKLSYEKKKEEMKHCEHWEIQYNSFILFSFSYSHKFISKIIIIGNYT